LLAPGHRIDPQQAVLYQCLAMPQRMLTRRLDLHDVFRPTWALRDIRRARDIPGPVGFTKHALDKVGWKWRSPYTVETEAGQVVDLRHLDRRKWEDEVRQALRRAEWQAAARRRNDMQGIEHGVDGDVTLALLTTGNLDTDKCGLLRCILSGAIWTQHRLHCAKVATTGVCLYCISGKVEDHIHL